MRGRVEPGGLGGGVAGRRRGRRGVLAQDDRVRERHVAARRLGVVVAERVVGEHAQVQERPLGQPALDEPELGRLEPGRRREVGPEGVELDAREQDVAVLAGADQLHHPGEQPARRVAQPARGRDRRAPHGRLRRALVVDLALGERQRPAFFDRVSRNALERRRDHGQVERHLLKDHLAQLVDGQEDALVGDRRGGRPRGQDLADADVVGVGERVAAVGVGRVDERGPVAVAEPVGLGVGAVGGVEGEGPPGVGGHGGGGGAQACHAGPAARVRPPAPRYGIRTRTVACWQTSPQSGPLGNWPT